MGENGLVALDQSRRSLLLLLLLLQLSNGLVEFGIALRQFQDTIFLRLEFDGENFHLTQIGVVENAFDRFVIFR